jgi:hypothetical protein
MKVEAVATLIDVGVERRSSTNRAPETPGDRALEDNVRGRLASRSADWARRLGCGEDGFLEERRPGLDSGLNQEPGEELGFGRREAVPYEASGVCRGRPRPGRHRIWRKRVRVRVSGSEERRTVLIIGRTTASYRAATANRRGVRDSLRPLRSTAATDVLSRGMGEQGRHAVIERSRYKHM